MLLYRESIQRVRLEGKLGVGFCFVFVVFFVGKHIVGGELVLIALGPLG